MIKIVAVDGTEIFEIECLKQHSRGIAMAYVTGLMVERLRNQQAKVYQQIPEQWEKLEKQGKKL